LAEGGGARMTKTSMPKVDAGGECARSRARRRRRPDWIEISGTLTSVEHHTGTGILNRKTKSIKFHSYRIITRKSFDRD
jgi:hypothetical protein